jgi:hydrogenase/urease accessory protein HupE
MKHRPLLRFTVTAIVLLPTLVFAHPGHGEATSFAAGAMHPLSGLDHLAGFMAVGVLLSRLGGRLLAALAAALLGLMVAAGTSDSDGWRFAAGFLLAGAGLIAAGMAATWAATRAATRFRAFAATEAGPRSPT